MEQLKEESFGDGGGWRHGGSEGHHDGGAGGGREQRVQTEGLTAPET